MDGEGGRCIGTIWFELFSTGDSHTACHTYDLEMNGIYICVLRFSCAFGNITAN